MESFQQKRKTITRCYDRIISWNWIDIIERRALYRPYAAIFNPPLAGAAFSISMELQQLVRYLSSFRKGFNQPMSSESWSFPGNIVSLRRYQRIKISLNSYIPGKRYIMNTIRSIFQTFNKEELSEISSAQYPRLHLNSQPSGVQKLKRHEKKEERCRISSK